MTSLNPKDRAKAQRMATRQTWRRPNRTDERQAHNLRQAMANVGVYPSEEADEEWTQYLDALRWYELQDILNALDTTDLRAIYYSARLLALIPRDKAVFSVALAAQALNVASRGIDPRRMGFDVDAMGIAEECEIVRCNALGKMTTPDLARLAELLAMDDEEGG